MVAGDGINVIAIFKTTAHTLRFKHFSKSPSSSKSHVAMNDKNAVRRNWNCFSPQHIRKTTSPWMIRKRKFCKIGHACRLASNEVDTIQKCLGSLPCSTLQSLRSFRDAQLTSIISGRSLNTGSQNYFSNFFFKHNIFSSQPKHTFNAVGKFPYSHLAAAASTQKHGNTTFPVNLCSLTALPSSAFAFIAMVQYGRSYCFCALVA